jgi:hypothetical protein
VAEAGEGVGRNWISIDSGRRVAVLLKKSTSTVTLLLATSTRVHTVAGAPYSNSGSESNAVCTRNEHDEPLLE